MTIKQNGGVFGRNPTFNDVTIEGQLTFDGDIDVGSDLKVDGNFETTGDSGFGIAPNSSYRVNVFDTSAVCMAVSRDGSDGDALQIFNGQNYGTRCLGLGVNGTHGTINNQYGNIEITTSSALIGKFTANGFAPENGKGIDFSATAGTGTSELFDDYEEGTWTPTLKVTGGDFDSVTYDPITGGRYTKIGNVVHFQGSIRTDAVTIGAVTGDLILAGLPYTAIANSGSTRDGNSATTIGFTNNFATNEPMSALVVANTNAIALYDRAALNGTTTGMDQTDVGTGANSNEVWFSGTYISA